MQTDLNAWIARLFADPDLMRMGHGQRAADANLGLGWIYYGLARALRPARVVVIGSWRGFVPLVLGRALADNLEGGKVVFIDPSLADDFWIDPARVKAHFASHGVFNVEHHRATTQAFAASAAHGEQSGIGLLFIDGMHTREQARIDFEAFRERLAPGALVLFHDSISNKSSGMYGEEKRYVHTVNHYMATLREDPGLQLLDLPIADGVTILRVVDP
jgi:predicted O-methyltransferase YrrM